MEFRTNNDGQAYPISSEKTETQKALERLEDLSQSLKIGKCSACSEQKEVFATGIPEAPALCQQCLIRFLRELEAEDRKANPPKVDVYNDLPDYSASSESDSSEFDDFNI